MTLPTSRRGASEFWLLLGLSALVVGGLSLLLWAPWSRQGIAGKKLVFYCAAGMAKPVQEIAAEYEQKYGVRVQSTFEGSGQLLAKIRATGTGDLFLSADQFHMDKAKKEGLVAEILPVAILRPVLIVNAATQEKLKRQGKPVTGLKDVVRPEVRFVLANPELAAIGKTTRDALNDPKIGLWSTLKGKLEQHSNRVSTVGTVNEVVTAVRTGAADLGVVWKANAEEAEGVVSIVSPELDRFKELIQIGVLNSARGQQATAALQFARFLAARDRGLLQFASHHFEVIPDADVWEVEPHLHLSAGAMLRPGIEDVVRDFETREAVRIDTSYLGCGLLVAQMKGIKQGEKPGQFPDAYFACDTEFLQKVQQWFDAGVIVSANDMVLIVRKGNPRAITRLEDLGRDGLTIGLADPDKAALGKLTDDLLKKTGLHAKVYTADWRETGRVVYSEAGHDLVNKMRVGALDAAVVYRSNALANPENVEKHLDVLDLDIAGALARQPFAIAKDSPHRYLMQRLLQAIVAPQSAEHFKSLGFRWVHGKQ